MRRLGLWAEQVRQGLLQRVETYPAISNRVSHLCHHRSWLVPSAILGMTPEQPSRRESRWEYRQRVDYPEVGH